MTTPPRPRRGAPLRETHPHLLAEVHPTRNGNLSVGALSYGSAVRVWWTCSQGPDHHWNASPNNRTSKGGRGCPSCAGLQASVTNSLAALYSEIAAQLDPHGNDQTADQIVAGSNKRFWWRCPEGPDHLWLAAVVDRTARGTGCAACAGKQLSVTNSLATRNPEVAAQLDRELNGGLTPDQVLAGSSDKAWWRCPKASDHVWRAKVSARTGGSRTGCPSCAGKQPSITNSLAALNPRIASEWHPERNGKRTPDRIASGSSDLVWWRCNKGPDHEWQAIVSNRTRHNHGCPCCAGKKLSVTNSLAARFKDLAAELEPALNGGLTADQIVSGGIQKVWWRCKANPEHTWRASLDSRTHMRSGCPACAQYGYNAALPGFVYLLKRGLLVQERKIGITNVPQIRLAQHRRNGWQVLELSPALAGAVAQRVEREFLAVLSSTGIRQRRHETNDEDRFDGYTEAWIYNALPVDSLEGVFALIGWVPDATGTPAQVVLGSQDAAEPRSI
ncbi:zinc-ribbon domain-containing protein [Actinoplanes sp. NPDC020271]|uniref:zinc-ribbon domain-containing protein n=1 Tax=Actinoplanes sp. NPDC020271 TaxID=3363896 RepID=UPI00379E6053